MIRIVPLGLAVGLGAVGIALLVASQPSQQRLAGYSTTLKGRTGAQRHNAQLALSDLRGTTIEPGELFSFTKTVGSMSRDAGYRKAPVSYNGTLIDDWGGGVCQTSTTLYNAALLAGLELVERHPHRFAPSYVAPGRDAAVAFSNIDLKFRNPHPYAVQIRGSIVRDRLQVEVWGKGPLLERPLIVQEVHGRRPPSTLVIADPKGRTRVRNSGKDGSEVTTYVVTGTRRTLLSQDSYPVMHRVVQRGG